MTRLRLDDAQHFAVEITEPMVAKFLIINEIPLPTGVFVAPTVALTRKINPFGMAELVAHKIQVAAVDGRGRDEANHLVQGDSAMHRAVFVAFLEMPVHIGVDEAENNRLVAHERLVVRLAVTDGFLVGTAIFHLPENRTRLPVLVLDFLDCLDPIIGNIHRHPIVETIAAVLEFCSESGHSADFLGDGDGLGIHLVDEAVGERQIANRVVVLMAVEIVAVVRERLAEPVRIVEHRGYAVEAEAVEMELLKPVATVRQEEMQHFVLAVVEAERVPRGMLVAIAGIEELVGVAGEVAESLDLVFHGVRVDDVHNDGDAVLMGLVDERFQFLGRSETA